MSKAIGERVTLVNGATMPRIGLGTWPMDDEQAAQTVAEAIQVGYRLFDTAEAYGNEKGVGTGIRRAVETQRCSSPRSSMPSGMVNVRSSRRSATPPTGSTSSTSTFSSSTGRTLHRTATWMPGKALFDCSVTAGSELSVRRTSSRRTSTGHGPRPEWCRT